MQSASLMSPDIIYILLYCSIIRILSYFFSVIFVIVYAVNNPVCVSHEVTQRPDKSVKTSPDVEVIIKLVNI